MGSLGAAREAVGRRLASDQDEDSFTLYYGLFAAQATGTQALSRLLEEKSGRHPLYGEVLRETQEAFFAARDALVGPSVRATLKQIIARHSSSACAMVMSRPPLVLAPFSYLVRCADTSGLFFPPPSLRGRVPALLPVLQVRVKTLHNSMSEY